MLVLEGDKAAELGRDGLELPLLRRRGQARVPAVRRPVVLLPPTLPLPRHLLDSSSSAAAAAARSAAD